MGLLGGFMKRTCKKPVAHGGCSIQVFKAKTIHKIDTKPYQS